MRRPLIAGNWKMNGDRESLAELDGIAAAAKASDSVDVAIFPPFTLIERAVARQPELAIGGQDCHGAPRGAHTGCTSARDARGSGGDDGHRRSQRTPRRAA